MPPSKHTGCHRSPKSKPTCHYHPTPIHHGKLPFLLLVTHQKPLNMSFSFFSFSTAAGLGVTFVLLTLLYRAALPKPIPGIPYNHASARSILGDIPSMMKWKKDTRETFTWMTEQCKILNAPMVQVFVKPFSLPWVIVTDARECEDVLTRRSKEFDRARFTTDVVQPILREHHFPFPSGPKQRAHRSLLSDLMTPAFLNEVSTDDLRKRNL